MTGLAEARTRVKLVQRPSIVSVLIGVVFASLIVAALATGGFLTTTNIRAVLFGGALVGILACGLTLITLSGNVFSMSLGITAAVCAISFVFFLRDGAAAAIVLTLLIGAAACGIQGAFVGLYGANPIIVTIGAGVIQVGVITWLTQGASVNPATGAHYGLLKGLTLGIPFSFYAMVAVAILIEVLLRWTVLGMWMRLLGESKRAARAAALPVAWTTVAAFTIAGLCAAATGILLGAANDSADLRLQSNYSFDAIAAVLIVGTPITGGRGSAIRSAIGAMAIAVISSVVVLRGYASGAQLLIEGVIVVLVVTTAQRARTRAALK